MKRMHRKSLTLLAIHHGSKIQRARVPPGAVDPWELGGGWSNGAVCRAFRAKKNSLKPAVAPRDKWDKWDKN